MRMALIEFASKQSWESIVSHGQIPPADWMEKIVAYANKTDFGDADIIDRVVNCGVDWSYANDLFDSITDGEEEKERGRPVMITAATGGLRHGIEMG